MMRKNLIIPFLIIVISSIAIAACNSHYTVKPRGYYKIEFPEHQYRLFDQTGYPYTFEYPVYAKVIKDTTFFEDKPENDYWVNIEFPDFNGKIYISYKDVRQSNLTKLVNDSYEMTYKHTSKASEINDSLIRTPNGASGMFFRVGGNAATANQFYVTDSTRHFLRGALYFDATPNEDSLSVVNDFLKEDMKHLINTLRWK